MKLKVGNYYLLRFSDNLVHEDNYYLIKVIDLDKYSDHVTYKIIATSKHISFDNPTSIYHDSDDNCFKWHDNYDSTILSAIEEYTEEEVVVKYFEIFLKLGDSE